MLNVTLKQKRAVEDLIIAKKMPREQLQMLLDNGSLSDLLEANFSNGFDRDEFRRVCGLKSLTKKVETASVVNIRELIANPASQPESLTEKNLALWKRHGLVPAFFPELNLTEELQIEQYVKPNGWFYRSVRNGKIEKVEDLEPTVLKQGWYLIDKTVSADYADGRQVFKNDPLSPLIERLRRENKIGKNGVTPIGSRFAITHHEWVRALLPVLAVELGLDPKQVRLERAIEFNFIGNVYDANRGELNAWEWFADYFEGGHRLIGGGRGDGGLAGVGCNWRVLRLGCTAGRPLVSFVS